MKILIVDNGSQYTHLIKRSYRDLGHEPEVVNTRIEYQDIKGKITEAEAIVLSGGPNSVYLEKEDTLAKKIVLKIKEGELKKPLLGICYGHQMIGYVWGAQVAKGKSAEYGVSEIFVDDQDILFKGLPNKFRAWVSHYDEVKELPSNFHLLAHSINCKIEAMANKSKNVYGVQFHPEVWHTEGGEKILQNFLECIK